MKALTRIKVGAVKAPDRQRVEATNSVFHSAIKGSSKNRIQPAISYMLTFIKRIMLATYHQNVIKMHNSERFMDYQRWQIARPEPAEGQKEFFNATNQNISYQQPRPTGPNGASFTARNSSVPSSHSRDPHLRDNC